MEELSKKALHGVLKVFGCLACLFVYIYCAIILSIIILRGWDKLVEKQSAFWSKEMGKKRSEERIMSSWASLQLKSRSRWACYLLLRGLCHFRWCFGWCSRCCILCCFYATWHEKRNVVSVIASVDVSVITVSSLHAHIIQAQEEEQHKEE